MRKLVIALLFAGSFTAVHAQKLEDVEEKFSKGKIDEAKEKIDKMLADPKNASNAGAWYWKGKVYTELAKNDSAGTLSYDAGNEAFNAFRKYQEMDKTNKYMLIEQNVGLFQLYDMNYNRGIRLYNDKAYDKAYEKMKNAMKLEEYIASKKLEYNGFTFPALDTQLVNLTASAAYLAEKQDEAIPLFERLADAKLKDKDYKEIYRLLVEYHQKKGNTEKMNKYLELGSTIFPDPDYWVGLEFGDIQDTTQRFARYEQLMQKYPDNYALAMDYSIELFNYTYGFEKKPKDYEARQAKLDAALRKAVAAKSTALANYVMSQHLNNQVYDIEEARRAIKGNTPAEAAKRKDINAKLDAKYEEMYPYALKAYQLYLEEPKLKTQDKINLRKAIDELIDYHSRKKQQDKVTFYEAEKKKHM